MFYIALFGSFGFLLLLLAQFLFISLRMNDSKNKSSTLFNYLVKLSSLMSILVKTILALPFFQAFFLALVCKDDEVLMQGSSYKCYSGTHLTIFIIGLIGFALMSIVSFLLDTYYVDFNPISIKPFA